MESKVDTDGCIFLWNIENVSRWNWIVKNAIITSPVFIANGLGKTKWTLLLQPKADKQLVDKEFEEYRLGDSQFVGINLRREDCEGPEKIEVKFLIALIDKNGVRCNVTHCMNEFSKDDNYGDSEFMLHKTIFFDEIEKYIHGDTLRVECTLFNTDVEEPARSDHLFATTVIAVKRRCFLWKIEKFLDRESDIQNKFEDYLISVNFRLKRDLSTLEGEVTVFDKNVQYFSFEVSIMVKEENLEYVNKHICFFHRLKESLTLAVSLPSEKMMENKSKYFPGNILSFELEFVLLTCENSDCKKYSDALESDVVGSKRTPNPEVLNYRYDDDASKDVQLNIGTEIIRAHKDVLTASSNYFKNLFLSQMKESKSIIEVAQFKEDTVKEMLKYIYTGSLEDLNYEMASNLLEISDYYEILSLKSFCSSFLQDKLCEMNACEILLLAHKCNDGDLKMAAQDYILGQKQIFSSQKWEDLMEKDFKLAADVMHRKITTGGMMFDD